MAPPSTPGQRRFLPSRGQLPPAQTNLQGGPHQFASTPRFYVGATQRQTVQQPPSFSTPASTAIRTRTTQYKPVGDDIDDSSPVTPEGALSQRPLDESIDIEPPSASASPSLDGGRPAKRLRVSISPEIALSSDEDAAYDAMMIGDESFEITNTPPAESYGSRDQSPKSPEEPASESESASPIGPPTRHPTFRDAPRFKAAQAPTAPPDRPPLPDAFSPQRRGTKYVPGGLAAELRDWLVQVKGASDYDRPAGSCVEMTVDEAVEGDGMWISSTSTLDALDELGSHSAKVILAGGGRISGLGGKNYVTRNRVVSMHQPMWDINLDDLGQLAVACDWEVKN